MFFKDKMFWQGLLLLAVCVSGLLFPTFIRYLFCVGAGVGLASMVLAILKFFKVVGM